MRGVFLLSCLLIQQMLLSQNAPGFYYVLFSDKIGTPFSVDFPQSFLSEKSIARREQWNIPITEQDLPVNPTYIEQVLSATNGKLHHASKWFNSITLSLADLDSAAVQHALDTLNTLSFVVSVRCNAPKVSKDNASDISRLKRWYEPDSTEYGVSFHQLEKICFLRR